VSYFSRLFDFVSFFRAFACESKCHIYKRITYTICYSFVCWLSYLLRPTYFHDLLRKFTALKVIINNNNKNIIATNIEVILLIVPFNWSV